MSKLTLLFTASLITLAGISALEVPPNRTDVTYGLSPKQVQAKGISTSLPEIKATLATSTNVKAVAAPSQIVLGTNDAMQYIFQHESGNRLDAVNSIGCVGLGQSCGGGLQRACPNWRTDRDCQINFFTNYCLGRYGSWSNAQRFWSSNRWW